MLTNGELRFMRDVLVECRTVFDVGANVGDWTALALGINPTLTVHCFEPSEATYQRLLARAFPGSVICNDFGLDSVRGERSLYVYEEGAGINTLYRREGLEDSHGLLPPERVEVVQLETVDSYCLERGIEEIDYLKADVEGHELEVFRGASRMLKAGRIRIVQFEYGGCNIDSRVLLKDFFTFFSQYGYRLHKLYPEKLRHMARYDQRLENFHYQNWIAVKVGSSVAGVGLREGLSDSQGGGSQAGTGSEQAT
jgi:FkbM family methyltransferase